MLSNGNIKKIPYESAVNDMRQNGDNIRRWAQQTENPLLQALALEVLEVAGGK